jgi:ABC-type transporter Mla maintaining outer membrane lipid asymmetry ATPase subunit MlaF
MSSPHASVVTTGLSFAWPDGTVVFESLDLAIGPGTTGLIGTNGSGKTTLLRLIADELRPRSGVVRSDGDVGYLPQNLTLDVRATVADLLGVSATRRALHAIEAGSVDEADFTAVGDDWDIEERVAAELSRLGLARLGLGALGLDARSASCPAARPCSCTWPRCSCGGPRCCCWTSRPTTSTWTHATGCTRRSKPGPA